MPSLQEVIPFEDPKRHRPILRALVERKRFSEQHMREYSDIWVDAEDRFQAHVHETEADALRRSRRDDEGRPQLVTIHVPYSYGMLMAAHTYWTSVFLSRTPIFTHAPRHGEAALNVQAIDALIDYQVQVGKNLIPYYVWLLDVGRYGFGVLWNHWAEEEVTVSSIHEIPIEDTLSALGLGGPPEMVRRRIVQTIPGFQGNKHFNVNPFDFLPDPRVQLSRIQQGEFVGRKVRLSWSTILEGEAQGRYFNIDKLRQMVRDGRGGGGTPFMTGSDQSSDGNEGSPNVLRPTLQDMASEGSIPEIGNINGFEMVVNLVPKDWKLGTSTRPEKWVFTVARDEIVIGAAPQGAYHNQYPVSIIEYEPEGYGFMSKGLLERMDPINHVMNFLVNSHFYNVRQTLVNQFIYDPSRVYEQDILDTSPGKMIRLRPEAYGTDVGTLLKQFPVVDVTRSNLQDTDNMAELANRMSGISAALMGALDPGGRKTATEVRSSSTFGINRLKTAAEFMSAQGWQPLDQMMVQNTQQYYSQTQKYRIAGDQINTGEPFISVTPESIQGFFDFVPVDGTLPVDKLAMSNLWRQMIVDMASVPAIAGQYNLGGIFEFVAQMAGLKGIKQFRLQTLPDATLASEAAAGNVVPIGGQGGRPDSPLEPPVQAPEPSRLPDTGRTQ